MSRFCASFTIVNRRGLHARAATRLVQLASRFGCDISVRRQEQEANAKSVMGVLLLCCGPGTQVEICARGPEAEAAVTELGALIEEGFGELD